MELTLWESTKLVAFALVIATGATCIGVLISHLLVKYGVLDWIWDNIIDHKR